MVSPLISLTPPIVVLILLLSPILCLGACPTDITGQRASTWMYQIDELFTGTPLAYTYLQPTSYDLLVLDAWFTLFFSDSDNVTAMLSALHCKPDSTYFWPRLNIAYIDIGQAETYRTYWLSNWTEPSSTSPGDPDFLLQIDPDGWNGSYQVAYWDQRWKDIWLGANGLISQIAKKGFDGVYLDWVIAYEDSMVISKASADSKDPIQEMLKFIGEIRAAGRAITPDFLVIQQNGPYLIDSTNVTYYQSLVDGFANEDTWFSGQGGSAWGDAAGGDIANSQPNGDPYSSAEMVKQMQELRTYGIQCFTIDYSLSSSNAAQVYHDSHCAGLVPCVSQVALSKLTTTPPPDWSTVTCAGPIPAIAVTPSVGSVSPPTPTSLPPASSPQTSSSPSNGVSPTNAPSLQPTSKAQPPTSSNPASTVAPASQAPTPVTVATSATAPQTLPPASQVPTPLTVATSAAAPQPVTPASQVSVPNAVPLSSITSSTLNPSSQGSTPRVATPIVSSASLRRTSAIVMPFIVLPLRSLLY